MVQSMKRLLVLAGLAVWGTPVLGSPAESRGIVVESVPPATPAERSGLQAGDVLLTWQRHDVSGQLAASGSFSSPFDLLSVAVEETPRGAVVVDGTRDGATRTWTLPPSTCDIEARPWLAEEALVQYRRGAAAMAAIPEQHSKAAEEWRAVAQQVSDPARAAWLLLRAAQSLAKERAWDAADRAFGDAVEKLEQQHQTRAAVHVLRLWSQSYRPRADWKRAEAYLQKALSLQQTSGEEDLSLAVSLRQAGTVIDLSGDHVRGKEHLQRALAIEERLAPFSIDTAITLDSLGRASSGDTHAVTALFERSIAILEEVSPSSLDLAEGLSFLGSHVFRAGDADRGERCVRRALEIRQTLAPNSLEVASSMYRLGTIQMRRGEHANAEELARYALAIATDRDPHSYVAAQAPWLLGEVLAERGDLAAADDAARRALAAFEAVAPGGSGVSSALASLGWIARKRGDLVAASSYLERAATLAEKSEPGGTKVANALTLLSSVVRENGDLDGAASLLRRALAIYDAQAPEAPGAVVTLYELGLVAQAKADLTGAREYHERALAIRRKLSPEGMDVVRSFNALASVALDGGQWAEAERYLNDSLGLIRKLAPGTVYEAQALHDIGRIQQHAGRENEAIASICGALDALDLQRGRVGGGHDTAAEFSARYADYDHDCIAILVEASRPADALQALERSRARTLLRMLAERDLTFAADLPADIAQARKQLDMQYDRAQAALERLSAVRDADQMQVLQTQLQELRSRQAEMAERIRKASPHFASLRYPEPRDLAGVQSALDPGTLLLAFSVGPEKTIAFAVDGAELTVKTIPLDRRALREQVEAFRRAILKPDAARLATLRRQSADLYRLLLAPFESRISASKRLVFSPDGPLHTLPFATLIGGTPAAYLAQRKPLHVIASATLFAEVKKARQLNRSGEARVAAFGNPRYPPVDEEHADRVANLELRGALRAGHSLPPLPATRDEVEAIARLFPTQTDLYVGDQARESTAKSIGRGVRFLHFACHGLLDERLPLNSALALSTPESLAEGEDNGLLQGWEIFESVRLDAELVTLSACSTALGKETGGEGLLGLTRAFQYAGARTVLASLWSVADKSTAKLMWHFYAGLKRGRAKDEALRDAQIALLKGPYSHPFHWAAFQLNGDWQ
jgi:CHAT domain-containing protein